MSNKKSVLAYILLIIWPFIFFLPLSMGYIVMGNDFDLIYYAYKKYIFEFWQDGQLPFWSPSEGAGFTLIYNPFAQFFYIPSWILFVISDIKSSFSLYDYLIFTIFGISVYSIGQYQWLKNLKLSKNYIIFTITLLAPAVLIFSNFLRFPNAIHTIAWLPFLLLGMNYSLIKEKTIKSFLLIFLSTLFIFTAGYPYFIFYIFIFSFFYFFFIFSLKQKNLKNSIIIVFKNLVPVFLSFLISFPWLVGVLKTLAITQDRNLSKYSYASETGFNLIDILGSWIYPVTANPEGRYYFGIIITFIIIKFIFDLNKNYFYLNPFQKKIIIFSILLFIIISFLSMSETKIFQYFWNKFEFIQNMRAWDRTNILMLPILSILLTIALPNFLKIAQNPNSGNNSNLYHLVSSNLIIFIILIVQLTLYYNEIFSDHWHVWQQKRFIFAENNLPFPLNFFVKLSDGRINIISTLLLLIFINLFFIKFFYKKFTNKIGITITLVLTLVIFEQFLNSNIQWSLKNWKTVDTHKEFKAKDSLEDYFNKPRIKTIVHGNNYFRDNAFTINNFLNWGNQLHNELFWKYFDKNGDLINKLSKEDIQNVETFFGLNNRNKKIFFSKDIDIDNIIDFTKKAEKFEIEKSINYKIRSFTNNSITIEFFSDENGYLSYIDNYDIFWHAYLNDKEIKISKLMNTYKSIYFQRGRNILKFRYEPFRY